MSRSGSTPTLLDRARQYLARNRGTAAGAAALVAVPLMAASSAQAGYLHKWTYGLASFDSGSGTAQNNLVVSDAPGGSKLTGSALYSLNDSAIALVRGGYSGLGAGEVDAGDRADFTWDFSLTDTGATPLADVQWELIAIYSERFGPTSRQTLASGDDFGTFSGAAPLVFSSPLTDMNWFGADLKIIATAPAPAAGQYQFNVALSNDGIRYAYVPIPEPAGAGLVLMLSAGFVLRRTPLRRD
jgi:hypothetical protein